MPISTSVKASNANSPVLLPKEGNWGKLRAWGIEKNAPYNVDFYTCTLPEGWSVVKPRLPWSYLIDADGVRRALIDFGRVIKLTNDDVPAYDSPLPQGWSQVNTKRLWSFLIDNQGRERATIFDTKTPSSDEIIIIVHEQCYVAGHAYDSQVKKHYVVCDSANNLCVSNGFIDLKAAKEMATYLNEHVGW